MTTEGRLKIKILKKTKGVIKMAATKTKLSK